MNYIYKFGLLRLLINVSVVLFYTVNVVNPSLWDDFLLAEPHFDPQKNPPLNNGGWFNRYNFTFNHSNPNIIPPRISPWKYAGYGTGICALGVSCFVAFYTYKTYVATNSMAIDTNRLADQGEVSLGLRTPESYQAKWGKPPGKK